MKTEPRALASVPLIRPIFRSRVYREEARGARNFTSITFPEALNELRGNHVDEVTK